MQLCPTVTARAVIDRMPNTDCQSSGTGHQVHSGTASSAISVKRAATYGRKSDPNDEAVRVQWETCRQRAKEDGYDVPALPAFEFGDDFTSGRTTSRQDLDRLLEIVRSRRAPFDRLYVRDIDRLTRADDPRFLGWFCYECKRFGVMVCFTSDKEHVNYDEGGTEVQADAIMKQVKAIGASEDLRQMKKRLRIAVRGRFLKGFHVGSSHPYGTERWLATKSDRTPVERMPERGGIKRPGHAIILRWDESKLPAIRFIFESIARGESARGVARALDQRHFPTPRQGGRWTATQVTRLARNPVYKGDYIFARGRADEQAPVPASEAKYDAFEPIYIPNYMPSPPISAELFARVQKILDGNADRQHRRMSSRPEFLLTGLFRCAACDQAIHGFTHRGNKGGRYRMYRHGPIRTKAAESEAGLPAHARRAQCAFANRYVRAESLEESILTLVRTLLRDQHLLRLAQEQLGALRGERHGNRSGEISAREKEMSEVKAQLKEAVRLHQVASAKGNEILASMHEESAAELSARLKSLSEALDSLREEDARFQRVEQQLPAIRTSLTALSELFENGTVEPKQMLRVLLEKIELDLGGGVARARFLIPATGFEVPRIEAA